MNFDDNTIKLIEEALDVTLYHYQKLYLTDPDIVPDSFFMDRQTGSTFVFCIRLALIEGEPLDFVKTKIVDDYYLRGWYRDWFEKCFYNIWKKLKYKGLSVREANFHMERSTKI